MEEVVEDFVGTEVAAGTSEGTIIGDSVVAVGVVTKLVTNNGEER